MAEPTIFNGVTMTQEGLSHLNKEELYALKDKAIKQVGRYGSLSGVHKVFMNAIYGAQGNKHYIFRNVQVASDITAEGRYYIKMGEKITNDYFVNDWHLDTELHKQLFEHPKLKGFFGEMVGNKFKPYTSFEQLKVEKMKPIDYVCYIDTDSIYVTFKELIESINYNTDKDNGGGSYVDFILTMNQLKMAKLFAEKLGNRVAERHGENFLKFDLENISEQVFFIAKKKYLMALKYTDSANVEYDHAYQHIKGKGIEIIQSSTPSGARKLLKYLMALLFQNKITKRNYQSIMRKAFEKYSDKTTDIMNKCKLVNIGKYKEYVIDEKTTTECKPRALPQYRGAVRHNHLLHKKGLLNAYQRVENQKVAWYYDVNGEPFTFAFGEYPKEIAPEVDYKKQFMNIISKPFSRLAELKGIDVSTPLNKFQKNRLKF